MCLVLLAVDQHPDFPLVLVANRDEFYRRPTSPADWWTDASDIFGGRDLQGGGTWLACHRNGRIAAVTNYRSPEHVHRKAPLSRGTLVTDWLNSNASAADFTAAMANQGSEYGGYNLLFGHIAGPLFVFSNVDDRCRVVGPGSHGLSNAFLDTPWPKVRRGRSEMLRLCRQATPAHELVPALLELLDETSQAPDSDLPRTGVGLVAERALSPLHVHIPATGYGTRCSTVLLAHRDGHLHITERPFDQSGATGSDGRNAKFLVDITPPATHNADR